MDDAKRAQREKDVERVGANDPELEQVNWSGQNVGNEEIDRLARALHTILRSPHLVLILK